MYCASLFNPTLVISLGVLLLVVGLFYFYVDYKFKEHTNKLNSVASLVTTLVSEINAIKQVNDRHKSSSDSSSSHNFIEISESLNQSSSLIEVSDDEDENGSDDEGDDDDDDESCDDMDDSSSSDDESSVVSNTSNKVVVNVNNIPEIPLGNYTSGIVVLKLDESPVETPCESLSLPATEEPIIMETDSNANVQVKNILLDDETQLLVEVDYKKMPVNKLRALVVEKNIVCDLDISKMKKPELIKLIEQSEVFEESE